MLLLYLTARICHLYSDRLPTLFIVVLHVIPPALFAFAHGSALYGWKGITAFVTFCLGFGTLAESLSLRTGYPFGSYYFTDVMGPKIFELPVLLALAYVGIGYVSWILAVLILRQNHIALPLLASCIMLAWDFSMDPTWSTVGRAWIWQDGGRYFGVPVSNFVGWFLTAWLYYQAFALYCKTNPIKAAPTQRSFFILPIALYAVCALGNLLILKQPGLPPIANDATGKQWPTADILTTCVLTSLFVMLPFAFLAWHRMHRRSLATPFKLALALITGSTLLTGQQSEDPLFRVVTRLISLDVTVTDKSGRSIPGLPRSAFEVFENGVRQEIRDFKGADVPVSLGLVIDNSGSMATKRRDVELAALTMVRSSNPHDEVFVVNFNEEASLDAPANGAAFTDDVAILEKGLKRIDSRGQTALRDALRFSILHLSRKAHRERRALLLVTDGNDNASKYPLPSLVRLAQQNSVLIYAIGLLNNSNSKDATAAARALNQLTKGTGGQAYYPPLLTAIDTTVQVVSHEIRSQYTITYSPVNQNLDGSFRAIRVQMKSKARLNAHTRPGYYADKDVQD
jgi:VWFA-related protein